jgi:hypothetical protein
MKQRSSLSKRKTYGQTDPTPFQTDILFLVIASEAKQSHRHGVAKQFEQAEDLWAD